MEIVTKVENSQCCVLCKNIIDKEALEINKRLNVKKDYRVCTNCMSTSNAEPFTAKGLSIQFI